MKLIRANIPHGFHKENQRKNSSKSYHKYLCTRCKILWDIYDFSRLAIDLQYQIDPKKETERKKKGV